MPMTRLIQGDCLEVMQRMIDNGEKVHSIVCDPPYHLTSVVKRFGKDGAAPAQHGTDGLYARASKGFMGKTWDGGDIAFRPETWRLCWQLLPPGGWLLAFGSTRTFHRIAVAIEDAGFEIRDTIAWVYGTGFPKSHDVSKGIDKTLGATGSFGGPKSPAHAGWIERGRMRGEDNEEGWQRPWMDDPEQVSNAARKYIPGSESARDWVGWGTALKPALEPITVARKPLEGTVARNVLQHGVGALNIDGCRVSVVDGDAPKTWSTPRGGIWQTDSSATGVLQDNSLGRWPANLVHDGSPEVLAAFPDAPGQAAAVRGTEKSPTLTVYGDRGRVLYPAPRQDRGSAARFFYAAKASRKDRNEGCESLEEKPLLWSAGTQAPGTFQSDGRHKAARNPHPTVKPTDLMQWLCRMVTPPGGTVLDPFMGSGSTGKAAALEGFSFVGIEQDPDYLRIAEARIAYVGGRADEPLADLLTALSASIRRFTDACP